MKLYLILFSLVVVSHAHAQSDTALLKETTTVKDKEIPVYNFKEIEPLLYTNSDTLHIVNFWAMWCAPCVKELPLIEAYKKNNPMVEVLLISLDFPEQIDTALKPFLKKNGITAKVVLLDDPDANSWIDKIDPNWSGSIPFTILFNAENRSFYEGVFETISDLELEINNTFKNK